MSSQIKLPDGPAKSVVVVGSLNMDLVLRVPRAPEAGETLTGSAFTAMPGGKGANQAVACARLGCRVLLAGRVGADAFGRDLCEAMVTDGIDIEFVSTDSHAATGVAVILVEDSGQNRIVLAPGANATLAAANLDPAAVRIGFASLMILQLEVPLPTVEHAIGIARSASVPVLLNPAPAQPLPERLWSAIDYLIPNESEAALLSGSPVSNPRSAASAAENFRARGVRHVLVTLGGQGVVIAGPNGTQHLPALSVGAVDTTAAGDTFIGGFATGLLEGMAVEQAARLGQQAAAFCVTRHGAQRSIPFRADL
jgi:ribokinase